MIKTNINTALIIIPHQDDEINLMGGLIPLLRANGVDLYFCFLTNGDAIFDGRVRINEVINALGVLGIERQRVYFLGYPDSNNTAANCLYKSNGVIETKHGHQTYGDMDNTDYAFKVFGEHSDYKYDHLKRDMKDCILRVCPDVIFATDFDSHLDHRICSMVFEEVVSEILIDENIDFYPYIYKGFAYSTAFSNAKDFYKINLQDTVKPSSENLAKNTTTEMDNPLYLWNNRVQFPVDASTVTGTLRNNILYLALKEHVSQCISLQSKRIINADKCFWERPTHNLIYQADISASSGGIEKLLDFRLFDVRNICERIEPLQFDYLGWIPENSDADSTLNINFNNVVQVKNLNLWVYSSQSSVQPIVEVVINNDVILTLDDFNNYKYKFSYFFSRTVEVSSITIRVLSKCTKLLYIEILPDYLLPMTFAKLKINGNFSYKFYLDKNAQRLKYEVYSYGINEEMLECRCDNNSINIGNGVCIVPKSISEFKLQVVDKNTSEVYDEVSIIRLSGFDKFLKKIEMVFDNIYINFIHKIQKIKRHNLKHKSN